MALVHETIYKNVDSSGKTLKNMRVPSGRKRAAYTKLLTGLSFLGAFVVLGPKFNYGILLQPWFKAKPLLYRYGRSPNAYV